MWVTHTASGLEEIRGAYEYDSCCEKIKSQASFGHNRVAFKSSCVSCCGLIEGSGLGARFILCEEFGGNANSSGRTIRDERYRLVKYESGTEEFYDIDQDPAEGADLLPTLRQIQQTHYDALLAELNSLN